MSCLNNSCALFPFLFVGRCVGAVVLTVVQMKPAKPPTTTGVQRAYCESFIELHQNAQVTAETA